MAGAFLFLTELIVVDWVKLTRQIWKQKILFVMCWLWSYPQPGGLDSFWV